MPPTRDRGRGDTRLLIVIIQQFGQNCIRAKVALAMVGEVSVRGHYIYFHVVIIRELDLEDRDREAGLTKYVRDVCLQKLHFGFCDHSGWSL